MARAGAPRIAKCEQNVCRRICTPSARWPAVRPAGDGPARSSASGAPRSSGPARAARGGAGVARRATAKRRVIGTNRTRPPFVAVTWPFQSDRSIRSWRFSRSTPPIRAPSSPRIAARPHRRAARGDACASPGPRRPSPAARRRRNRGTAPTSSAWAGAESVQGSRSITSHSTAVFSSTFSTVSTLFTVFAAFVPRWCLRRCTSSFVIASSFLLPRCGIRCVWRIVALPAMPLGFCRLARA